MEQKLFTVIIPTIWKTDNVIYWIEQLSRSKYVGEIILIDNNINANTTQISNTKLKHIRLKDNIYVNPAWNLGVSEAKYDNIVIANDDIYIDLNDLDFIFDNFKGDMVGLTHSNYTLSETIDPRYKDISDIKKSYNPTHKGFGCFMLLRKDKYVPIPDDLKIAYGDNWLMYHTSSIFTPSGIKVENRPKMSASVESNKDFYELTKIDKINWETKYEKNSTICLNMIVKNESHIIEKTLETLVQQINFSYWVISDTGSTDNTIEIIENFFQRHGIPGEIRQDAWVDFSHNRNLALNAAKDKADYLFIFDADDDINGSLNLPNILIDEIYLLKFAGGGSEYFRPLLIQSSLDWNWEGVLHEYLVTEAPHVKNYFTGDYSLVSGRTGDRNNDPNKYFKDAKVLENAYNVELAKSEDERHHKLFTRYSFYCAQSYRDCEHREEAVYWYRNTVKLDTWIEEIYYSHLMAGRLLIELDRPDEAILHWIKGQELNVGRAECYYEIAKYYRSINNMEMAYSFAILAKRIKFETTGLFVETHIHDYLIDYELTLSAYYVGEIAEGYRACKSVLENSNNAHYIKLTESNIKYYK